MGEADVTPDRKRRRVATPNASSGKAPLIDLTENNSDATFSPKKKPKKSSPTKVQPEEKRLKRFRPHPPLSYNEKLERAKTQRMFLIDRVRHGTDEVPEETVEMAGTTGNIYRVTIGLVPSCTCPDHLKGNQCKHVVYVLHKVLKAPEHLQYQLAFLSSELRGILASAPQPTSTQSSSDSKEDPNRKEISGDCPICFTEFEPGREEIVYCKAACGNNVHKQCFEQWAKSQLGKEVRCIYCRTAWQGDEDSINRICKDKGLVNGEGYINVASELGLSGMRDHSSYHQPWVRRQGFGYY